MKLYSVNAGYFKLDGGAMFGVVPKSIWNKLTPADERNMCSWATRCLLIEDGERLILIDTGFGDKQDAKFFSRYFLTGEDNLEKSLARYGFAFDDITDVVLTHLHFDHCGGSIKFNADKSQLIPAFKNAKYYVNEKQWNWALNPNARERASFLKENIFPIEMSGQLNFINKDSRVAEGISFIEVSGHTEAMMLPKIKFNGHTILYMADLIPSVAHLPLTHIMGYDIRPLETLKEKTRILSDAIQNDWKLFFEHDSSVELISLERGEKGAQKKEELMLRDL